MARLSLLLLAHWRSIPTAERKSWHLLHRARCVAHWRRWRYGDGDSVWFWCRQLSIYEHELLHSSGDAERCDSDRAKTHADNRYDAGKEETHRGRETKSIEAAKHDEELVLGTFVVGDEQHDGIGE